jgi:hypothetical protein
MSIQNDRPPADYRHPSWCSPAHCCAPDRLAERGESAPYFMAHNHFSAPANIEPRTDEYGDPSLSLQLFQTSDEKLELGQAHLTLTVKRPDVLSVEAYDLGDYQLRQLADRLVEAADVIEGHTTRFGGERS